MAFLIFCGVKKVDSCRREACGWGRGGCPGISYRTFAYSCHTWGEVTCVVGCLSLNIFHALLLSCPRNKWYKWSSNLAKYNLFFFFTRLWKVAFACLSYKCPKLLHVASISLYNDIPHHTNYFVWLYQVWRDCHCVKKGILGCLMQWFWQALGNFIYTHQLSLE